MAGDNARDSVETFETWLLRRVAYAVESGEVAADLLAELSAEIEGSRNTPPEESHAQAIREIAEALEIAAEEVEHALTVIESQPAVTRELLIRRIAEAWLEGQRKSYEGRLERGDSR